jgi:hypothetical protein
LKAFLKRYYTINGELKKGEMGKRWGRDEEEMGKRWGKDGEKRK